MRGTVRSTKNEAKLEPLKLAYGELYDQLELVEADLLNEESIINACEGVKYVVHTASPFPVKAPKDENELVKPAVEGTLAAMKGAEKHGVSRVIITASMASVMVTDDKKKSEFDHNDWSNEKICQPYEKSKTLAEKAAWDFL